MYAEITPPGPNLCPVVMQTFNSLIPPHTRVPRSQALRLRGIFRGWRAEHNGGSPPFTSRQKEGALKETFRAPLVASG